MLLRLTAANLTTRPTRTILTVLAIAFSVALVVAMTSGFAAFENAATSFMGRYAGVVDARIGLTTDPTRGIGRDVLDAVAADPRVKHVFGRFESDTPLPPPENPPASNAPPGGVFAPRGGMIGVERERDALLAWLKLDSGRWFNPGEDAFVVDSNLAERQKLKVGDKLKLRGQHGDLELPVVGIVHLTAAFGPFGHNKIYAPLAVAQQFVYGGGRDVYTSLSLEFQPNVDAQRFLNDWAARLATIDPLLRMKLTRTTREEVDKNLGGLRLLSALGGEVSLLTAAFIIFSTLSMGVAERQRVLATLRAIGMNRLQVATTVIGEAILLVGVGLLVGIPIGYAGAAMLVKFLAQRFSVAPTLDWAGVLIASGSAMLAAIVASLMPAWHATRVDPLEAMTPLADSGRDQLPWKTALLGLLLIAIDPTIFLAPYDGPYERELRFYLHFVIGLPSLMLGFFLIAPVLVALFTQTLGRLLAALLRVPFAVMRQQTSDSNWRAAGWS
jgi:putative ABC transport system permease protein